MFSPLAPARHALGLETIYEGYLVALRPLAALCAAAIATPRSCSATTCMPTVWFTSPRRVTSPRSSDLAELISLCAQARADGGDGDGAAWAATAAALGRGDLDEARSGAARAGRREAVEAAARVAAGDAARRRRACRTRPVRRVESPRCSLPCIDLLAAEKTAAEEGRDVVLSMLVVGLVFVVVAVGGDLLAKLRKKH